MQFQRVRELPHARAALRQDPGGVPTPWCQREPALLSKRSPPRTNWTVLRRRKHMQGQWKKVERTEPAAPSGPRGPSLALLLLRLWPEESET